MDGIIHAYRYLTSKAQMLPKWAYGYIQSKEQYYTSKELEEIVRHYRNRGSAGLCGSGLEYLDPGNWGEDSDQSRYGDGRCMEQIHEMHAQHGLCMAEYEPEEKSSNFLMPDIFCMIMQPMMLLMKKQEKCTGNRRRRGCLTRALIPGGVTPQSRFPVRTGAVR